jgi:hypothetical protein
MGFEPTTSSMPSRRAPNCATAPPGYNFLMLSLEDSMRLGAGCQCLRGLAARNEFDNRGVRKDCDQRSGERGVVELRGNEAHLQRNSGKNEGELAVCVRPTPALMAVCHE